MNKFSKQTPSSLAKRIINVGKPQWKHQATIDY